ncbi:Uncharacterised protein [Mycobacteroides abscessus]|nr:Uncharacterised protein [Mycobacteroides abscessus]
MSVPVLSAHTTSTRASPSMAGSSCTRHRRRPSRTTPIAKATEVRSTRPSGTMGTRAATMPSTDCRNPCREMTSWFTTVRTPAGTSSHVMTRRIESMPDRSSERTSVKALASCASRAAYAAGPTSVAR